MTLCQYYVENFPRGSTGCSTQSRHESRKYRLHSQQRCEDAITCNNYTKAWHVLTLTLDITQEHIHAIHIYSLTVLKSPLVPHYQYRKYKQNRDRTGAFMML